MFAIFSETGSPAKAQRAQDNHLQLSGQAGSGFLRFGPNTLFESSSGFGLFFFCLSSSRPLNDLRTRSALLLRVSRNREERKSLSCKIGAHAGHGNCEREGEALSPSGN
jgi:hypothetical protein